MKSTGDAWMGTAEAAEHLGVTLRTLYRLIDTGQVPAYKFGRVIRLRREEVEAFIGAARIAPGQLSHLYPPGPPGAGTAEGEEGALYRDQADEAGEGEGADAGSGRPAERSERLRVVRPDAPGARPVPH